MIVLNFTHISEEKTLKSFSQTPSVKSNGFHQSSQAVSYFGPQFHTALIIKNMMLMDELSVVQFLQSHDIPRKKHLQ